MHLPTIEQAHALLEEAQARNPGPWVQHSLYAAQAAQAIASRHPRLDPEAAYVLGCLHDIGRRAGRYEMRHALDGYRYLDALGYPEAARVALTHSFPIPEVQAVASQWDCSPQEQQFVGDFLARNAYNDYDRLVQLCDCLALPSGFCLIEKRMVDVALRYGTNAYSVPRWKAYLQLQHGFEAAMGCSVYSLLPGVVENTFGIAIQASG
ncbi:MAG: HD domain-containing protein [Chloroflexota bacterium]